MWAHADARVDSLVAAETRVHWASMPPESALAKARRAGMPAFLDFYATWCAPCVAEFDEFVAMHRMYRGREFELFAEQLRSEESRQAIAAFFEKRPKG